MRLKKLAYHDLYDRDKAMIYINDKFYQGNTHSDCLNEYMQDNDLTYTNNENYVSGRGEINYELKQNKDINQLPFACLNVTDNNIFIETDTLKNITLDQLVGKIKEEFPDSNVYKETDDYGDDNYTDYHDEDLSKYKRLAKNNKQAVYCREPEDRDYNDGAVIILNNEVLTGITHAHIINNIENLKFDDVENIAYAHKDSKNNAIYLETDSLENISVQQAVNILKNSYPGYNIYDNDTEEKLI